MVQLNVTFVNHPGTIPMQVSCMIDNTVVWEGIVKSVPATMCVDINDYVAALHQVSIKFSGKTGIENNDVGDTIINISDVRLQNIDIEPVLQRLAKYYHNTNGYSESLIDDYSNCIGFDGRLEFQLETPISNWFYKNYPW